MYLHIGQSVLVPISSVIGIFDMDNSTSSHITRAYLSRAEKEGRLVNVWDDLPKSFIICQEGEKVTVYLSQLGTQTLLKRSENFSFEKDEFFNTEE